MIATAHRVLGRDVFVTLAPYLLKSRNKKVLRPVNAKTPKEAAKIVGLFLRTRNNYTCGHTTINRGLFYWALARYRLPSMWKYFSACIASGKYRSDDIAYLGQSILTRGVRVLEAKDAIGGQFYLPQNNDTRDIMMYHFDYLTVLLSGIFDAQARVASRAYGITKPKERNVSFRNQEFQEKLEEAGAGQLSSLCIGQSFIDLMILLYELRNTIHGAGLPTFSELGSRPYEESFVKVLPAHRDAVLEAAKCLGGLDNWGLRQTQWGPPYRTMDLEFEPYTYALTLVDNCFSMIDKIASLTDVMRLAKELDPASLNTNPPTDNQIFSQEIGERLLLLG